MMYTNARNPSHDYILIYLEEKILDQGTLATILLPPDSTIAATNILPSNILIAARACGGNLSIILPTVISVLFLSPLTDDLNLDAAPDSVTVDILIAL